MYLKYHPILIKLCNKVRQTRQDRDLTFLNKKFNEKQSWESWDQPNKWNFIENYTNRKILHTIFQTKKNMGKPCYQQCPSCEPLSMLTILKMKEKIYGIMKYLFMNVYPGWIASFGL